ncbi:MAG: mercuric reductase, partial [Desulfobacterales bacterium]|nr:mercuric reductase [Desulfobacterales bacterium]
VPSKTLLKVAKVAHQMRTADRYGLTPAKPTVDLKSVMSRVRNVIDQVYQYESPEALRADGIDVLLGNVSFIDPHTLAVNDNTTAARRMLLTTGAHPFVPPITGLDSVDYLTYESIWNLEALPARLLVVGAGPIGCELAQSFARFGSDVVLIESMHGIMSNEDQRAADIVKNIMEQDGVKLRCCGKNLEVRKQDDGIHLVVDSHGNHYDEVVDQVLLAVGRTPSVDGLNLAAAGVEYDKKGVKVNDRLQTTNRRIYAAGDICFPYKFTHTADATARIVIQNALFFGRSKANVLNIPWCTYTDPEVAHVGLYPHQAEEKGMAVETFTVRMNSVDRAILESDDDGFLDVYVKKGADEILGATMVCRHAGDMISEITLAMAAGAGLGTIARTIHPYPTQAEAIKKAGDAYNRTRLTPRVQKIFKTLLKWRR